MTKTILELEQKFSKEDMGEGLSEKLLVTAFMGGEKYRHAIQLTMVRDYFCLTEAQVKKLILVLQKRLKCAKGYSATD